MSRSEYTVRAAILLGMVVITALLLLACWTSATALLLLFAAGLLAVFLRGLADLLAARTSLSPGLALLATVVGLAAALGLPAWLLASAAIRQASELVARLPAQVNELMAGAAHAGWGEGWLGVTEGDAAEGEGVLAQFSATDVFGAVTQLAGSVSWAALAVLLIVPAGLFFAAQPGAYFEGALRLLPVAARLPARAVALEATRSLGRWLIGQGALMAILSAATGLGLWALGVQLALFLGLLRGVLSFIPHFGPAVAAIPALILAAGQGGSELARVAVLYVVLQIVETYGIAPRIARHAVHLSPMLLVPMQLLLDVLLGIPGIVLAAPVTVVALVLVQRLYIERVLGEAPVGHTVAS